MRKAIVAGVGAPILALALGAALVPAAGGADGGARSAVAPETPAPAESPHGPLAHPCEDCHDTASWVVAADPRGFRHEETGFPLEGAHARAWCRDCHAELAFAHVGSACEDCHEDPHRRELGLLCHECHTPASWENRSALRHEHAHGQFPLLGAHARVDCDACHRGPQGREFVLTPVECDACHLSDYLAAGSPDHAANGFGTDCERCHSVFDRGWRAATFVHSATFPLAGGHGSLACEACHAGGYAGTPTDCYACHEDDYRAATPDHLAAGFGTECTLCHSAIDRDWRAARFAHDPTFPLTGAHRGLACEACHAGGYGGTPTDCFACHEDDYRAATPDHVAAGFPTSCGECHGTSAWSPATFDHELLFPLQTGRHAGLQCADCHVYPSDYGRFECILCHEHARTGTDEEHREVSGYSYVSTACLECHPRGVAEGDRR